MRYGGIKTAVISDGETAVTIELVTEESELHLETETDENIDGEHVYQGETATLDLETLDLQRAKYEQLQAWNRAGTRVTAELTGHDNQHIYFDEPSKMKLERSYEFVTGTANGMRIGMQKYSGTLDIYLRRHTETQSAYDTISVDYDSANTTYKGHSIIG